MKPENLGKVPETPRKNIREPGFFDRDPKHMLLWKHAGKTDILGLQISLKLLKLLREETILADLAFLGKGLWEGEEGGRLLSSIKRGFDLS